MKSIKIPIHSITYSKDPFFAVIYFENGTHYKYDDLFKFIDAVCWYTNDPITEYYHSYIKYLFNKFARWIRKTS
jgi:hypothetical protein